MILKGIDDLKRKSILGFPGGLSILRENYHAQ